MERQEQAPTLSVCIVTGRRLALLDRCLESLQRQLDPPAWELLVCSDRDPDLSELVHARFPEAVVGLVRGALPGAARNFLVERARGQLLLFLDDDVTVRFDLLHRMAAIADEHPESSVFGGPNETPPGSSRFQIVQGAVLASLIGAGPVRRRYGAHPAGPADERWFTLCNLAIRRDAMLRFDASLVCAEENELMDSMSRRGALLHYDPRLVAYHERRATLSGFAQQMYKYGRGRGQLLARRPASTRLGHVVPTFLLAYVVAASAIVGVARRPEPFALVLVYLGAVLAEAVHIGRRVRRFRATSLAAALIVVLHTCYGLGVVSGVLRGRRRPAGSSAWTPLPHQGLAEASTASSQSDRWAAHGGGGGVRPPDAR